MSQHDFEIANQGFPSFRSDLNSGLQALASNSAGATEPSTTYAYQFWYDSTANLLKMRNTDDDAWITLAFFDQTNDEWEVRSAVIQAVDSAGVTIKDDSGTSILTVSDGGGVDVNGTITSDGADLDGAVVINESGADVDFRVEGDTEANLLFVDASENRVGIGTSSPSTMLHLKGANPVIQLEDTDAGGSYARIDSGSSIGNIVFSADHNNSSGDGRLIFQTSGSEHARIESSGSFLFGSTDNNPATNNAGSTADNGISINRNDEGSYRQGRYNGNLMYLNRTGTDGDIITFFKDAAVVGAMGHASVGAFEITGNNTGRSLLLSTNFFPGDGSGAKNDGVISFGIADARWNDIYATNGTIQTSDRNEKQDIEELSEAEQRVAVACKGLLRKFRWIKRVEEKGDDARIHFGIIAQDLKAAFEAEGLDAGRYAMFCNDEWWETYTDVPAVEAQDAVYETVTIPAEYDEDGNEITPETTEERLVSEAIEGKEAYTRTDTYYTEEEAPEGAVKKSRMGVRYSELLAFIIAAI